MDTRALITELHREQMRGLRHIARQQARIIEAIDRKRNAWHRVFLSTMWKAFSERLATNLGQWAAGLPLWFLALEFLGFRDLLAKLAGLSG